VHDGLKIAIGAGATALMAWGLHGPLGQGDAFLARQSAAATPAPPDAIRAIAAAEMAPPANVVALAAVAEAPAPAAKAAKAAPEPAPPPAVAIKIATGPVPAGQCQKAVDGAVAGRAMVFQPGSAWLNATSLAIIKDLAATLKHCSGYALEIAGHTDNVGDEGVNRIMSEERARRVRDALVARGISAAALSARGFGSSRPIAGKPADPANRRITFTVSAGGA